MKIDINASNLTQSLEQAAPTNPESVKGQGHRHPTTSGDQVQLSDLTSQLSALASATDPAKLAQLQIAYKAGTYNVSPSQIAGSIINELMPV
jgi:anti-sigma28 factor (negative regulator of flagellin synthesis)